MLPRVRGRREGTHGCSSWNSTVCALMPKDSGLLNKDDLFQSGTLHGHKLSIHSLLISLLYYSLFSISHETIESVVTSNHASHTLPKNPQRKSQHAHGNKAASQDIEDCKNTVFCQPVVDKVGQSKCKQISSIDGNESYDYQQMLQT